MTDKPRVSQDDATVPMRSGEFAPAALARHRVRAAVHRIVADCERLLGDVDGPARDTWRDAVGRALLAGRRLQSIIERGSSAQMDELPPLVQGPQQAIVDAMSGLLTLIPTELEEELIMQDARAIREAALGLLSANGAASARASAPSPAAGLPLPSAASAATARIVVADDDDTIRKQLVALLERLGYSVTAAPDGRRAFAIAERDLPDLVITDLSMPEMTGHELLQRLKATETTKHIPVIVVSGEGDTDSVVRCLENGAEDHLTKPYTRAVLQARIRTSLERKRMRDLEIAYLRRVAQLTSAAEAVERHSYSSSLIADLVVDGDPLGQLARVFDRMINGMRTREEQLESRVRQLRSEIEHVSKTSPVAQRVSDPSHFAVGHVLAGRYEIVREIGMGGMGMVYLARDRELAEDVAVKVVRQDLIGQDPSLLERLKSEMRLARKISHRNVVRSHDMGESGGTYFLTMEYIKGMTVAELTATRGRLGTDSTLAIATQLADALATAHAAGIIHRDIKPQNLLVDDSGVLKVTDFGLARPLQQTVGLTAAGTVVGTPAYMAPEQLMGGEVDGRSDLYATGVVLYECLTGRIPFEASSPFGLITRMLEGPPPPVRNFEPGVPQGLASAVHRLLEREPDKRFKSARELADQLALIS